MLKPDDFEIGMYITVLNWIPYERQEFINNPFSEESICTIRTEDNSYKGDVLEILTINVPYIVVKQHSKYASQTSNISLDTRRTKFIPLTQDYVDNLLKLKDKIVGNK